MVTHTADEIYQACARLYNAGEEPDPVIFEELSTYRVSMAIRKVQHPIKLCTLFNNYIRKVWVEHRAYNKNLQNARRRLEKLQQNLEDLYNEWPELR